MINVGVSLKRMFREKCNQCNNKTLFKDSQVHSNELYCNGCYEILINKGEVIPPIHYKRRIVNYETKYNLINKGE